MKWGNISKFPKPGWYEIGPPKMETSREMPGETPYIYIYIYIYIYSFFKNKTLYCKQNIMMQKNAIMM
jgi:hypothetical protein